MSDISSVTPEKEIERICASAAFRRSTTQSKLLRYLGKEALEGRGHQLNQYLIATEGMGLPDKFDPTRNSCVRVWGVRLRGMLEQFYSDPENIGPLRVRLPERSFCPVFEIRDKPGLEPHLEDLLPRLAVIEFRAVGLRGSWRHFPSLLAEKMVACVAEMEGVAVLGPFERNDPNTKPTPSAGPAAIGRQNGVDFFLDGSLFSTGDSCRAQARLLRAESGVVCSTGAFSIKMRGNKIPTGDLPISRRLARFVEDGFGTVWREVERASIARTDGPLSPREAMMHVWHAYSTMSPCDISAAQNAIKRTEGFQNGFPVPTAFRWQRD